ncbi:hypothetical protein AGABI2DRAFT_186870 [Agaricus bisporus var. bisporus H97]|uniref:hypothetical protein n=1 Tax=Agaricus bisporus var. bisporus (strain H97 / ATCC MYA-4626 / FGSC 10389) TaxID=936046 RepID=UPI00029F5045|nr:hypothetical protein AGABI2DRAFT_186870 [Agaricus bisporus var. bisporus H97]EKV45080.1 hypothetical protein AGABI2DRAFT_186870 [Agaricus bisporus var. bisporus H97]
MTSSKPLVCVFLKLPPSRQSVSQIHEIAWNVFLPQLNRLNDAFEAAQATYPSPKARKIWSEARKSAARRMSKLQDIGYMNFDTACCFLEFMKALQLGRGNPGAHSELLFKTRLAVSKAGVAQEILLNFREDIRIGVGHITSVMSGDGNGISLFTTESSQIMLELATAVEECTAILEEHREELKEIQRQSPDENDSPSSEAEFQMVQEKWLAFLKTSGPFAYKWHVLEEKMEGPDDSDEPAIMPNNPMTPTMLKVSIPVRVLWHDSQSC